MSESGHLLQTFNSLVDQVDRHLLIGARETLEAMFIGYATGGHILIEGPPGCGKTRAARLMAQVLGKTCKRIQFTSDLLPADIIGANTYTPKDGSFQFIPGPVFAEVIVADELNRAPPRTQSALLEAMEESQVTVEGKTYPLAADFFLLATQNPLELEGTFPLPEAQMDRFLMRLKLGHAGVADDQQILELELNGKLSADHGLVRPVAYDAGKAKLELQSTRIDPALLAYIAGLLARTRKHPMLSWGASIRGGLGLSRAARVKARLEGRDFVVPDDIKKLAVPVLSHRLKLSIEAQVARHSEEEVVQQILNQAPFPS